MRRPPRTLDLSPLLIALTTLLGACSDAASTPSPDTAVPTTTDATVDATIDAVDGDTAPPIDAIDTPDASEDASEDAAADATPVRTTFAFEPIVVSGVAPVWGASAVGGLLIGGVNGAQKAQDGIYQAVVTADGVEAQLVAGLDIARYCLCAALDPVRHELLVIGGRGATFADVPRAVLVDVADGEVTAIDDAGGAADFPVGCAAWFAPDKDRAYVYGGLSSTARAFTATTHRWNPETRTFGALRGDGPPARYDAALHVMADGDALLASGMGLGAAVVFYDDLWRFDTATETWSEVVPATEVRPPGRRYAWSALSPDESILLFGFGSDSPTGATVLADLWTFTFATSTWAPLAVDGALPSARGFAPNWQVGDGDAGLLAFGMDAAMQVPAEAYALRVPTALRGAWH